MIPYESSFDNCNRYFVRPAGHALTQKERKISEEWHTQMMVIEGQASKTIFGYDKFAEVGQDGASLFGNAACFITTIQQEAIGTAYQAYVEEFTTRQIQAMGRAMLGATEAAMANIGYEIQRSLYPPPEKGLLARIFGGE